MKINWTVWILFLAVKLLAQTITTQPSSQVVVVGENVMFRVAVSGTGPFTYQWQFNGINLPTGIITTVAGNGTTGYSSDDGKATNAALPDPSGLAVDGVGNLFIADHENSRIRKVGTNGIITTVAGNGTNGYSGDGGTAINAELSYPISVAVDSAGNLFIADIGNSRIRKVGTNGIITTVAGNGTNGYSGDGGVASNTKLNSPNGVAIDSSGNIFIADFSNQRIRKVDTNGVITTVAGNGTINNPGDGGKATNATLSFPTGVAIDSSDNLFIADWGNNRIRKVDVHGIITTVAGNGGNGYSGDGDMATNAELYSPYGATIDSAGNLFIADFENNRIRKVDVSGIITTVAGNGIIGYSGDGSAATNAKLSGPIGVAMGSAGDLFIADYGNGRIRKVEINPPTLLLNNVSTHSAGNYSVVITGSDGSVTSSIVTLTVLVSTSIAAPKMLASGHFQFSFNTAIGINYAVEYSTNLIQWFPIMTLGGIGAPLTVIDPNTAGSLQRFYRINLSLQ